MVTWMQVMAEVQRLDDKRMNGEPLSEQDASSLVAMLLEFHNQAVVKVPVPSSPSFTRAGKNKPR